MPTPQFRSQLAAALVGLLGTAFLVHSLAVHPQDAGDKPSATQSKESSSGASSGGTTTQGGTASQAGAKLNQTDERMMKQLAESNLAEISTGKLAQEKAQSEEVKSFAKKMVDDHTKSLEELRQLAQSKGVTLPSEPNAAGRRPRAQGHAQVAATRQHAFRRHGPEELREQGAGHGREPSADGQGHHAKSEGDPRGQERQRR